MSYSFLTPYSHFLLLPDPDFTRRRSLWLERVVRLCVSLLKVTLFVELAHRVVSSLGRSSGRNLKLCYSRYAVAYLTRRVSLLAICDKGGPPGQAVTDCLMYEFQVTPAGRGKLETTCEGRLGATGKNMKNWQD
jgi:hypothetical protein